MLLRRSQRKAIMKLVVDVGNSRLKWAQVDSNVWHRRGSIPLTEKLEVLLNTYWADMDPPQAVLVSNVSGQTNAQSMTSWLQAYWDLDPVFFQSTVRYRGMVNGYSQPTQLGCDRWAALIGARSLTKSGALCVVDCGTALTVDAVTAEDRFIGGVIFPGIDLIQESLLKRASDISENRAEFKQVFGTTTAECVSGGSFIGTAGAIDRILSEMCSIVGEPKLYISGGDAPQLLPLLRYSLQYEPDLVLLGLAHTLS